MEYNPTEFYKILMFKNAIFWDLMLCGSCKNRHVGGMYRPHLLGEKTQCIVFLHSVLQLLVTGKIVPTSLILSI
jgi:hypothetical protein